MRRRKFGNRKVATADGEVFDSRAEHRRWLALREMEARGEIRGLRRQVRFELVPRLLTPDGKVEEHAVHYLADFVYRDGDAAVAEDCKSAATRKEKSYVIKRKLFKARYPEIEFREHVANGKRL